MSDEELHSLEHFFELIINQVKWSVSVLVIISAHLDVFVPFLIQNFGSEQ